MSSTIMVDGAAQKLRSLGMPESRIREIQGGGTVSRTIEWPAPASGTVLEKKVVDGQRVMAGDELYRIADLSTVWVIAEVPERDIGSITLGSAATVTFRAFPSQPVEGRVTSPATYPVDANPGHELDAHTQDRNQLPGPCRSVG
jgi:Cu(I)/Ag(I) efflux system membrane fusion protein